jgi:hypothetical protein
MAQESECQVEAKPLAVAAIIQDAHDTSCVLPVTTRFGKKFPKRNRHKFGHFRPNAVMHWPAMWVR